MNLGALANSELLRRLHGPGLCFRTGPFVISLKTKLSEIIEPFSQLYRDFPVLEDCEFVDYHVSVYRRRGIPGLLRAEGIFNLGGYFQFDPFPLHMGLAYLEWGLNCCVSRNAHQYLILHSAVLERDGRAALILGRSGAGKSTLCSGMSLRHWRLLSDEMALLSPDTGLLAPIPRPISLKNESIEIVRQLDPNVFIGPMATSPRKGTMAHMRPDQESVIRASEPVLPGWFLFPNYQPGAQPRLEPISKAQAMVRAARNAFNYGLIGLSGFEALAAAIDVSSCYRFTYGELNQALDYLEKALITQEASV